MTAEAFVGQPASAENSPWPSTSTPAADPSAVFVKPVTDYRALRKQVKEQQRSRRTLKYPVCLDLSLYDELEDLQEQVRQEAVDSIGRDDKPQPAERAGSLTAEGRMEALEQRMRDASIVAVFHIPSPEQQAARAAAWDDMDDVPPAQRGERILNTARSVILDAFSHWLDHAGAPVPADQFGLEDLREIVQDWTQGMVFSLSREITERSTGAADLPFSVQRSLLPPTSAAT